MGKSATTDVAIIGAGAAGIAAARRLRAEGLSCQILEARTRTGGRAWTETAQLGVPLDRGCAWLHDAGRNPLRPYAEATGLGIPTEIPLRYHRDGRFASPSTNQGIEGQVEAGLRELARNARVAPDQATSNLLPELGPDAPYLRYVLTAISGAEPEAYSSGDAAEEDAFEANWLVRGGLGRLISDDLGAGLPVSLTSQVEIVDHRRRPVRLRGSFGTLRAETVIVTVPPAALTAGRPAFRPELGVAKQNAMAAIPMGYAEKIALRLDGAPFGNDAPHFLTVERQGELMGFHIEPGPPAVAIAYTGGALAGRVAGMSETGAVAMAVDHLAHAYGESIRDGLVASTATSWASDPWSLGSYSAARPGGHHERRRLAEPVGDHLRFAGEATLDDAFATVHGAWLSGVREADAVAASLTGTISPAPSARL